MDEAYSRRQLLAGGVAAATALGLAAAGCGRDTRAATVKNASSIPAAGNELSAVKHVVFLMQENRSFDHYFGTLGGVAGFEDTNNRSAFTQDWPRGPQSTLRPFHMTTESQQAECTYDLDHSWVGEHLSWNDGAMDAFVSTHTSVAYDGVLGINTMGYYTKPDLPFYYALAEHFTICDNYHCSVLGPTHPNRLMQMTGTIDPAGVAGGPILVTNDSLTEFQGTCSWKTMPEVLTEAGITWKTYNPSGSIYGPGSPAFISKNMLLYFKQFQDPNSALYDAAFNYTGPNVTGALTTQGPNHFAADVAAGTLPQVSWIVSPDQYDEHPPAPPALGEWYVQEVLDTLVSNPEVWASTVLFIMYDENDGFFDHVPPPVPPAGTKGEYITASPLPSSADGVTGPIGLGMRVPMLIVSPFSAGGWVCHDVFDHTSQLQFLERVFGVTAPNISSWRRSAVGDLTAGLPTLRTPVKKVPALPRTSDSTTSGPVGPLAVDNSSGPAISDGTCTSDDLVEVTTATPLTPFRVPSNQRIPEQMPSTLKKTPA